MILLWFCRRILCSAFLVLLSVFFLFSTAVLAEDQFSILVTSNLQGKFSVEVENQEILDPLLVLGQNIVFDRTQGIDLYLDMGNALYPGIISKYSSGSVMVDFLDYFSCAAVLVSSKDIQVGTKNLELMQESKKVQLLSSNIVQESKPVFKPWFEVNMHGSRVAFLGISSKKVRFDVAEKELYNYSLIEDKEVLESQLKDIQAAGIEHIVLLSGQALRDTVQILETYPEIEMALCGGDYAGHFLAGKLSRVDLADGRSIVMADDSVDYYHLNLVIDGTIKVRSFEPRKAQPLPTRNFLYHEFKNRLTLWKEKFREDEDNLVAELGDTENGVNDLRFGNLLRDRFNCELGVVEENTINQAPVEQDVRYSDFLSMVNRDYNIFIFSLSGDEVKTVQKLQEDLVIAGIEIDAVIQIQGTSLVGDRQYRVAASQPAMQRMQRLLGRKIEYSNTWMTVTNLLIDDLKNDKIILSNDYDYLDRRFRTTIDASLSNFVDNSSVKRGDNIETPPGQPSESYNKWGLENTIDITIYNKYHRFILTPYMFYTRQDDSYLNNILRGTFLYDYNLSENFKPYNKFRYDTVVEEVDGRRPSLLRETMGISTIYKNISGKLGLGFEKEVQDPSTAALYGVEFIIGASVPLWSNFTYTFGLDTFTGILDEGDGQWQNRSEINNTISAKINDYMSISFRHKYFYFNDEGTGETYQNSQFITSLDLTSGWKFW